PPPRGSATLELEEIADGEPVALVCLQLTLEVVAHAHAVSTGDPFLDERRRGAALEPGVERRGREHLVRLIAATHAAAEPVPALASPLPAGRVRARMEPARAIRVEAYDARIDRLPLVQDGTERDDVAAETVRRVPDVGVPS